MKGIIVFCLVIVAILVISSEIDEARQARVIERQAQAIEEQAAAQAALARAIEAQSQALVIQAETERLALYVAAFSVGFLALVALALLLIVARSSRKAPEVMYLPLQEARYALPPGQNVTITPYGEGFYRVNGRQYERLESGRN